MILCICRAVSERKVREVVARGARSVDEVGRACGAGTGCGACRGYIANLLEDACCGAPRAATRRSVGCPAHDAVPAEATG